MFEKCENVKNGKVKKSSKKQCEKKTCVKKIQKMCQKVIKIFKNDRKRKMMSKSEKNEKK